MVFEKSVIDGQKKGWIEVITGSMFSGKTEELIRRLKRAVIARQRVEIFKPHIDHRYSRDEVVSHDDRMIHSTIIVKATEILSQANDADVIGVDEAQFFDSGLVEVCNKLADEGVRVIVAGLDMDYRRNPFGPLPGLMATAEYVTKIHAICVRCGNLAQYSYRKSADRKLVYLGERKEYEPLCRQCYNNAKHT